jgi:hypothetical protein
MRSLFTCLLALVFSITQFDDLVWCRKEMLMKMLAPGKSCEMRAIRAEVMDGHNSSLRSGREREVGLCGALYT